MQRVRMLTASIAVLAFSAMCFADSPASSPWSTSLRNAKATSDVTKRPLLLYFTTDYCGYCRKLERTTWSDSRVESLLSSGFVSVKVDGAKQRQLTTSLGIEAFPSIVILSPEGKVLERVVGYLDAPHMMAKLEPVSYKSQAAIVTLESTVR